MGPIYGGLPQWYSISFINTNTTLSGYPFIRFILDNGLSFNDPPSCNSTTILPFNESGLICILEGPQTIRVSNIMPLAPIASYNIWFKMNTTDPIANYSITPTATIRINHNNSVDQSLVSNYEDVNLLNAPFLPQFGGPK
jgi:hypothetical protein